MALLMSTLNISLVYRPINMYIIWLQEHYLIYIKDNQEKTITTIDTLENNTVIDTKMRLLNTQINNNTLLQSNHRDNKILRRKRHKK